MIRTTINGVMDRGNVKKKREERRKKRRKKKKREENYGMKTDMNCLRKS